PFVQWNRRSRLRFDTSFANRGRALREKRHVSAADHNSKETFGEASYSRGTAAAMWTPTPARAPRMRAESPQEIFEALDELEVSAGGREWRLEVFGVVTDEAATWVQLRLSGCAEHMLTLKLRPADTAQDAIATIVAWLAGRAAATDSQQTHEGCVVSLVEK